MPTASHTSSRPPSPRPDPHPAIHGSRYARFRRGLGLGLPIFLAYAPVGAAFGVLARTLGFSVFQAVFCSATAFSGAGQFIALSLLSGGATALMTILATSVVNSRYLLFGTTLSPHLRGVRPSVMSWLAFTLTDETFAVNIADRREGLSTPASMAGAGAIALSGWVLGTGLGAAGAAWIGNPGRWGLDFAMAAMFSALFVALAENRRHVYIGILAGVVAVALPLLSRLGLPIAPSWFVMIAAVVSASVATVVFDER